MKQPKQDQRLVLETALVAAIDTFNASSESEPIKDVKIKRIEFEIKENIACTYQWVKIGGKWVYMCV